MPDYQSALSDEVQATTDVPAPTLNTVSTDATSADLAWTANHNNGDTRVEYRNSDNATWIVDQTVSFNTTTATVSGLQNGTDHDFRVVADTTDAETPSNELTETTVLPDEDQPVLGNGVEDEISVDRETVVSDTGSVRYQIRETGETSWDNTAVGFDETVLSFDTLTFDFTGLEDGEEYEVRGRTETPDATGNYTTPVSIVTQFPGATGLTVTNTTADSITLEWQDNADAEDGFRIERRDRDRNGVGAWSVIDTVGENPGTGTVTYTDNSVSPASQYDYRVEAFTDDASGVSNTVSTFTDFETLGVRLGVQPNLLLLSDDEITAQRGIDAKKTHTGISDFRIGLAGNRDVEAFAARQDQIIIDVSSGAEFIGYVTDASHSIRSGATSISGYGIAKRLEETRPDYESLGGSLTYSNISVQEALRDYWARTEFTNYTVFDQPLETVATNELVQSADTQSEWQNTLESFADTAPLEITSTGPIIQQTCFTVEAENQSTSGTGSQSDADYSDGAGETMLDTGDSITQSFTPEYDIPIADFNVYIRIDTAVSANPIDVILDGETLGSFNFANGQLAWLEVGSSIDFTTFSNSIIAGGTSHTLKFEVASSGNDATVFDVLAPLDDRYTYTFDNDNGGSSGYLDGPELFPPSITIETQTSPVSFNVASTDLDSTWNDTTNNQSISVSNDGGATYNTTNNSQTVDFSYTGAGREVKTRFTLSRYGSRTSATPQTGYLAQEIDSFEHRADGNNLAVIVDLELSKNHFDNLKTLHDAGGFVWNIEHDDKAIADLTVESFRRGSETKTLPVDAEISSNPEINGENYYNSIYIQGALQDDGTRPVAEVEDSQAVSDDGRVISPGVLRDLDISTEGGAIYRARTLLERASQNNALRGTKTYPADFSIQPGYAYSVSFAGDGSTEEFTLEELALRYTGDESTVQLDFIPRSSLSEDITELKRNSKQQSDRV